MIGLIAGGGKLPLLFAAEAKRQKRKVYAFAFPQETNPELSSLVEQIFWVKTDDWAGIIRTLKELKIWEIVVSGLIRHQRIFGPLNFSPEIKKIWDNLPDKKATTLFSALSDILHQAGIKILPSTTFLESYLTPAGVLTKRQPSEKEWEDILFAYPLAKKIAELDIGQTLITKDKAIIAVEAMEGTDQCIRRAGQINPQGNIVLKVARPNQDLRFDLPVAGLDTLALLKESGTSVFALEAKMSFLFEREKFLEEAEKINLSVVGIE